MARRIARSTSAIASASRPASRSRRRSISASERSLILDVLVTPAASQIDVFARSAPLATLTFNDGTVAANAMAKDTTGRFYGQSASTIPAVVPPAVHPTITVDASGAGNPSTFASNLTDVVTIAVAEYSVLGQTLTIDAASSDQVSAPVLTADGTITLTPGVPTIIAGVLAPPAFVTVTSSLGGSKSVPVVILP